MSTFKTISKIQCRQKRMQKNRHGVLLQFNSVQNSRTYWGRTHSAGLGTCCAGRWLPPGEEGGRGHVAAARPRGASALSKMCKFLKS